jgi:hypothetical protein
MTREATRSIREDSRVSRAATLDDAQDVLLDVAHDEIGPDP